MLVGRYNHHADDLVNIEGSGIYCKMCSNSVVVVELMNISFESSQQLSLTDIVIAYESSEGFVIMITNKLARRGAFRLLSVYQLIVDKVTGEFYGVSICGYVVMLMCRSQCHHAAVSSFKELTEVTMEFPCTSTESDGWITNLPVVNKTSLSMGSLPTVVSQIVGGYGATAATLGLLGPITAMAKETCVSHFSF
jgi:hypothetical protein